MELQNVYLESQIQTADSLELVRLLYRAAIDATRGASAHLAAGRIAERARQISKAHAILAELSATLDHARGGAISRNLAGLYDYMQRRLLEANQHQKAEPLAEVAGLLATLLEGWEQVVTAPAQAAPSASPYAPADYAPTDYAPTDYAPTDGEQSGEYGGYAAVFAPGGAAEYASQSWSF